MESQKVCLSTIQGEINVPKSNPGPNQGKRDCWSDMSREEEDLIHKLHHLLGDRWGLIAGRLPNRKAEEVERYWGLEEKRIYAKTKLFKPVCARLSPNFRFDG